MASSGTRENQVETVSQRPKSTGRTSKSPIKAHASAKARNKTPRIKHTPAALAEVALISGATCAQAGDMALSKWLGLVASGDAPQPVIKQPRYTRWALADVRQWLVERARAGSMPQRPGSKNRGVAV